MRRVAASQDLHAALVPLSDALLCLVFFLLILFVAPSDCPHRPHHVPSAANVRDNVEAPHVSMNRDQVKLDGLPVIETATLSDAPRPMFVESLSNMLRAKRELWRSLNPNAPFPGVVVLEVERNVPAVAVKSVFQTAAHAGYPNVSFLVLRRPRVN